MLDFAIFAFTAVVGLIIILVLLLPDKKDAKANEWRSQTKYNPHGIPGAPKSDEKLGNLGDVAQSGSLHQYLLNLHERCGSIAAFWWQNTLVVSLASPDLFRQTSRLFDRPVDLFLLFEPLIGKMSIQYANDEDGRERRRNYDVSFSHEAVNDMMDVFNKLVEEKIVEWEKIPRSEHIPIHKEMVDLAIKAIVMTSFGDFFNDDSEVDKLRMMYNVVWSEMEMRLDGSMPEEGSARMKRFEEGRQWIKDLVHRVVEHRQQSSAPFSKLVFIDNLMSLGVLDEQFVCDSISYMIGGFHTSGNQITWALYYLATNQDVQDKVHAEVVDALGAGGRVTPENAGKFSYLKQVLNETLRASVLAPYAARYATEDTILNGYTIPKGTPMFHALGVVLQDKELYPDPTRFDPDRFSPDNVKSRPNFAFEPFGFAGKRKCPGYRFASTEGIVFLARLIQRFRVCLPPGQIVEPVHGLVTSPKDEIWITLENRL
ncbi:cytochrome P450 20A1-like [Oscarella lobularis]|uniref:cytochrome P450 20A1-like n=1 Tax=Oscarella lobularis TaxID=121494 RepID=UPI003313F5E6